MLTKNDCDVGLPTGYGPYEGGIWPVVVLLAMLFIARLICLTLFIDCERAAASRTFWTAGMSRPIRIAMIAITTSSSMNVKADERCFGLGDIEAHPFRKTVRKDRAENEALPDC